MQRNSVNLVILDGRLGQKPEIRYTGSGSAVANLSLATNESRKDAKGENVEHTEWHRIVVFGKTAEFCGNYLDSGNLVNIQGRLQTRSWEDKEGVKRYTTEIVADKVTPLGGGNGTAKGAGDAKASSKPSAAPAAGSEAPATGDDPLPF
jgi:single-strand DNA-binding protein